MSIAQSYKPAPMQSNSVPKEGNYWVKVNEAKDGTDKNGRDYIQVDCIVNCEGKPHIKLFISNDGNATAFFDTFGIPRGDFNYFNWKEKRGMIRINLRKNGEYTNMVPLYILDENGFVIQQKRAPDQQQVTPQQVAAAMGGGEIYQDDGFPEDIPF